MANTAKYATSYQLQLTFSGASGYTNLPIKHAWMRTHDDATALAYVRSALNTPRLHLENLYDRRAIINVLNTDPLYLNLLIVLTTGTTSALLLALVGDLLASWLSVRMRLASFAVLRALGGTPWQIARVLMW